MHALTFRWKVAEIWNHFLVFAPVWMVIIMEEQTLEGNLALYIQIWPSMASLKYSFIQYFAFLVAHQDDLGKFLDKCLHPSPAPCPPPPSLRGFWFLWSGIGSGHWTFFEASQMIQTATTWQSYLCSKTHEKRDNKSFFSSECLEYCMAPFLLLLLTKRVKDRQELACFYIAAHPGSLDAEDSWQTFFSLLKYHASFFCSHLNEINSAIHDTLSPFLSDTLACNIFFCSLSSQAFQH